MEFDSCCVWLNWVVSDELIIQCLQHQGVGAETEWNIDSLSRSGTGRHWTSTDQSGLCMFHCPLTPWSYRNVLTYLLTLLGLLTVGFCWYAAGCFEKVFFVRHNWGFMWSLSSFCIFNLSFVLYFPPWTDVNGTVHLTCADVPLTFWCPLLSYR